MPPARSGIARYSVELLPLLADHYAIDVFVDSVETPPPPGVAGLFSAHDFLWKNETEPYALVVFQLGNSPAHDYMWPYLTRYPGLVVLHDGQLHHARARALLQQDQTDDYRAEFHYCHPAADPTVAELGVEGLMGSLTYLWPMRRIVLESGRAVLVHNPRLAGELRSESPLTPVHVVEMGVPETTSTPQAAAAIRRRHQVPRDAVLVALFGRITPEKRVSQILRALAACRDTPPFHLLLCGDPVDHYDARAEAAALGLEARTTLTGFVPEHELARYIAAADLCLCLRWPSSRETSASWLRCLAAGKPTVLTDLTHQTDIPALDPRDWSVVGCPGGRDIDGAEVRPVAVTIDILDEDHSLALALRRLIADDALRAVLGEAGHQLWRDRFTVNRMAAGYRDVMEATSRAPSSPDRRVGWPDHLSSTGTEQLRAIVDEVGARYPF